MQFTSVPDFLTNGLHHLGAGPVALLFAEDATEINSTLRHHLGQNFRAVILFGPAELAVSTELQQQIIWITTGPRRKGERTEAVNALIDPLAGRWIYVGHNAEYLYFPFCETRTIGDVTRFIEEERRASAFAYVIDLYPTDLDRAPDGVSLIDAHLDQSGYFAHTRRRGDQVMERQLDIYGGLRWRFEEHVPQSSRRIDRVALFKAKRGVRLRDDFTLTDEEMNTYTCPWHHSVTVAVCSFRAAKALRTNPGSSEAVTDFAWHNSVRFNWHSRQLLELGLMESGQWF